MAVKKKMVQAEVKKKTRIYGIAAVLSALFLVSTILILGSTPSMTPINNPPVSGMTTFLDETAIRNYLTTNQKSAVTVYSGGPLDSQFFNERSGTPVPQPIVPNQDSIRSAESDTYSTTNIQVAGVDEADLAKNDGEYLYLSSNDYSNNQNYIYIVKAEAEDPRVISRIPLENNTYMAGMYLSQDSDRLVVIGSEYQFYVLDDVPARAEGMIYPYQSEVSTFLKIYDISDKVHPSLAENFTLTGSYFNSRMIGDYVYIVVSQPAQILANNILPLPRIYTGTEVNEIAPSEIYYSDTANYTDVVENYFTYTTFFGLNVKDSEQGLTNMTILMGGASTMYVSLNNMYVTYPTWSDGQYTSIYRISIDNGILSFQAKGTVPGDVLNQYSMDEYNNFFRLATTNWKDTTQNSVYVVNMNLTTVGTIELKNAEIRETIMSARFIGDKAYIVTFEQKDPFFVLDMSDPTDPRVAGELEIPGYSSYLHPYDDSHIIGLGMENSVVKLSLFDVTNVNNPIEIANYTVQGDYSCSDALYDPKAFLFDKAKQLLVIPASITQYGVVGDGISPPAGDGISIAPMGGGYWQGAYVFNLSLAGGFELRGGITHQEKASQPYYYGDYNLNVKRTLFIGNTLYTVSNAKVKLNSLATLAFIAEVNLL
jgi:inhibitor of cysteine peptidase